MNYKKKILAAINKRSNFGQYEADSEWTPEIGDYLSWREEVRKYIMGNTSSDTPYKWGITDEDQITRLEMSLDQWYQRGMTSQQAADAVEKHFTGMVGLAKSNITKKAQLRGRCGMCQKANATPGGPQLCDVCKRKNLDDMESMSDMIDVERERKRYFPNGDPEATNKFASDTNAPNPEAAFGAPEEPEENRVGSMIRDAFCPECRGELYDDLNYAPGLHGWAPKHYYCPECASEVSSRNALGPDREKDDDGMYGLSPAERNPSMGTRRRRY